MNRKKKVKKNMPIWIVWDLRDNIMCGIYKNQIDALERSEHLVATGMVSPMDIRVTEHTLQ